MYVFLFVFSWSFENDIRHPYCKIILMGLIMLMLLIHVSYRYINSFRLFIIYHFWFVPVLSGMLLLVAIIGQLL